MEINSIKAITDLIFLDKNINELSEYDLLIINADWAEEELAKDLKIMLDKNIINKETTFIISKSHSGSNTERLKDSADILIENLSKYEIDNQVIINDKYISNSEIAKNIDKLVNVQDYKRILRIAKSFVARRWFMVAKKHNFPIDKCDFYGVNDNRNISKDKWYITKESRDQVMKEFINIYNLYIDEELSID